MFTDKGRCYIIAEIGGNFRTYDEAIALIDAAEASGVDCVKLQTYRAETLCNKKAFFDMESTGRVSQYDYFKSYEISEELHSKIVNYFKIKGLAWFSTPAHETDLDMLIRLGMRAIKIGADDANNLPFLQYCGKTGLPIVLSSGMCTMLEVHEAIDTILRTGNSKIVLLHCISGYPTYPEEVNLNVLKTFQKEFPDLQIGFSDHTLSPLASITAVAFGAKIIERHFTLDKNAKGPDHMISADPEEMKYIIDSVRCIEKMMGSCIKKPYGSEVKNRANNRKSIFSIDIINAGEKLTQKNIGVRRPGKGIEPKYLPNILGKKATRNIDPDEILDWGDFS